jgi:glucan biosynthesis protein C
MTSLSTGAASAGPERLHGLDALRGVALLLGLVVHASLSFLPGAQYFWISHDPHPSAMLGLAFYVPHMFRMLLFFLIAGFFGRLSLERLGMRRFARDRFKRITLVLAVFWPIVFSGIIVALVLSVQVRGGTLPEAPPPGPAFTPDDFPLTHLWFLYVLTLCYAAMLAARIVLRLIDRRDWLSGVADHIVRLLATPAGPVLLALPLAAALAATPGWLMWFGIPTPDRSLYPNLAACVAFGSAFVLGWWLHRRQDAMRSWVRHWPWHLAVAIGATAACLGLAGLEPSLPPAAGPRTWGYAALYALGGWSWTVALTGLALRYLSSHSPARRYLADASYWIYLLHLPLVMILQVYAVQLPGPAPLKLAAVLAIALLVLLATYRLFVRHSWIGAFLNGRRCDS